MCFESACFLTFWWKNNQNNAIIYNAIVFEVELIYILFLRCIWCPCIHPWSINLQTNWIHVCRVSTVDELGVWGQSETLIRLSFICIFSGPRYSLQIHSYGIWDVWLCGAHRGMHACQTNDQCLIYTQLGMLAPLFRVLYPSFSDKWNFCRLRRTSDH